MNLKKEPSVKIIISYHKPYSVMKSDIFVPLHLGRLSAQKQTKDGLLSADNLKWLSKHMQGDDTGDNISALNRKFCELTAMYWAWKNYDKLGNPDYIGFMHYRRHFIFKPNSDRFTLQWGCIPHKKIDGAYLYDSRIKDTAIRRILQNADIITTPRVPYNKNIEGHYREIMPFLDIATLQQGKELAAQTSAAFARCADEYFSGNIHYWYHSFIMKKEIFFQYAQWLFDLVFRLDAEINYDGYDTTKQRTVAYIAERWHGIWLTHALKNPNLKIKELPLSLILQNDKENTFTSMARLIKWRMKSAWYYLVSLCCKGRRKRKLRARSLRCYFQWRTEKTLLCK